MMMNEHLNYALYRVDLQYIISSTTILSIFKILSQLLYQSLNHTGTTEIPWSKNKELFYSR